MAKAKRPKGDTTAHSKTRRQKPQDDWIPIDLAIFRFGIEDPNASAAKDAPSANADLFSIEAFEQSREGDLKVGYKPVPSTLEYLAEVLRKQADASKVEIDRDEGRFQFFFTSSDGGARCQGGKPWEILWEPDDELRKLNDARLEALLNSAGLASDYEAPFKGFAKVGDDEAAEGSRQSEGVRFATGLVWRRYMLLAFDRAVAAGGLKLFARVPSPRDDFEILPSDIWPLLDILNWEFGIARDPEGTTYYRIYAAVVTAPPLGQSIAADEKAAAKAVAEKLKTDPHMRKTDAFSFCESQNFRISGRRWQSHVWPNAREIAGLPPLAPRGRKSSH